MGKSKEKNCHWAADSRYNTKVGTSAARYCRAQTGEGTLARKEMDDLPAEMLALIWQWTDVGTRKVLACVSTGWRATGKAKEARTEKRWRSCWDALKGCCQRQRCAIRYASRMAQQRRWDVFDWMVDLTGPFEGRNEVDKMATRIAAEDGDVEWLHKLVEERGYRWDAAKVSEKGARYGHKEVVRWAKQRRGRADDVCKAAAKGGRLEMLIWSYEEKGYMIDARVSRMAAKIGAIDVLEWLETKGGLAVSTSLQRAAESGQIKVLRWLAEKPLGRDTLLLLGDTCIDLAATGGHQAVIEWLCGQGADITTTAMRNAATGGHRHLAEWMRERGCEWDARAIQMAAKGGHQSLVEWMRGQGCEWDDGATQAAAESGHLDLLQWLRQRGCPWDRYVFEAAGKGGHVAVMEWAWSEGLRWWAVTRNDGWDADEEEIAGRGRHLMMMACDAGQLKTIMWLRGHRCKWTDGMCEGAIKNGHLHIMAWARMNGCAWNLERCVTAAIDADDTEMLDWIRDHTGGESGWKEIVGKACAQAIQWKRFAVARWFLSREPRLKDDGRMWVRLAKGDRTEEIKWAYKSGGCRWGSGDTCAMLVRHGYIKALKWVHERGCPWDGETCWEAAKGGHTDVLEWAVTNGCPWDERTAELLADQEMHGMVERLRAIRSTSATGKRKRMV